MVAGINLQHMLIDRFLNTFIHRYYRYIHSLNSSPNSIWEYKLAHDASAIPPVSDLSLLTRPVETTALFIPYPIPTHELISREIQDLEMHRLSFTTNL